LNELIRNIVQDQKQRGKDEDSFAIAILNRSDKEYTHKNLKSYNRTKAIWWYTRESCLYRILNKALRVQNIDVLFAFRFFIRDLYNELTKEHGKLKDSLNHRFIQVFRGQVISIEEFTRMKASIGEFISINSFFSASKNRERISINKTVR